MVDKYRDTKDNWNKNNPDKVKKSKANYEKKRPNWQFRPTPELQKWLEKERRNDSNSNPETNAGLVIRKLKKLMKIENQEY